DGLPSVLLMYLAAAASACQYCCGIFSQRQLGSSAFPFASGLGLRGSVRTVAEPVGRVRHRGRNRGRKLARRGAWAVPPARLLTDRGVSSLIFACCESAIGG